MSEHEITVRIDYDGEASVVLLCHAEPEAPCRRRPVDWEDREEWTPANTDLPGFPCWAVEFVVDGGLENLRYGGHKESPFTYAGPVEISYDDCVMWQEPEASPGCGGPECRTTMLHAVDTCPMHREDDEFLYGGPSHE